MSNIFIHYIQRPRARENLSTAARPTSTASHRQLTARQRLVSGPTANMAYRLTGNSEVPASSVVIVDRLQPLKRSLANTYTYRLPRGFSVNKITPARWLAAAAATTGDAPDAASARTNRPSSPGQRVHKNSKQLSPGNVRRKVAIRLKQFNIEI